MAKPRRPVACATDEAVIRGSLDTTRHRDPALVAARLTQWLAARHPGGRVETIEAPLASGASSELFFVSLSGVELEGRPAAEAVLRMAPAYAVYPHVDLAAQFRCMDLVARRSPAPVPRVYFCESDPAVLGAPFLLMERRHGRGAPDWPSYVRQGWLHDLAAAEQAVLWRNAVEVIAAVHRTGLAPQDVAELGLPFGGATLLDQSLRYWRRYLELDRQGGRYPELEESVAWLERQRPNADFAPTLVWGDASLRNMLFDGLQPCALMDFEFAHVGIHAFDIAFFALMDYVMAEGFAGGAPRLPGFPGVQETLDLYERASGRVVPHREYFVRMALTYMSLATTRVFQRLAREKRVPPDLVATNPPLRILGEVLRSGKLPP
ncbi:MAG: phosphotransferase family protein [Gammaproteobacteria bacterium]|nr:phosphotransferase family protein [Gammaproteobacteria bacterium]